MLSVSVCPKVITLSGFHCIINTLDVQLTLLYLLLVSSLFAYFYRLVNVISFYLSQGDSIKRLPPYFNVKGIKRN
jgi:hypothetical protein